MNELIRTNLLSYVFVTIFSGLWISLVIFSTFKKTNSIHKVKILIRTIISSILICLWIYFFVYVNLYPVSLAYYEYRNNSTQQIVGVVDSIELTSKDRLELIIDKEKYTMVYSSVKVSSNDIINNITKGDTVQIKFGKKSKFIFDISEEISIPQ